MAMSMYPIRRVDRDLAEDIEYLGTKRKFWFSFEGKRCLFKAEERGTGEDWAEKVVSELASLLGVPHVEYELAQECVGGQVIQPGVICPTIVPRPRILVLGNQLLVAVDDRYPSSEERRYGIREYTVEAVARAVSLLKPPGTEWTQGAPAGIGTALGFFIGYVMLDAWVANQDRHHQNWGAIWDSRELRLAPSFDHGASLARNLNEAERRDRLETRDQNRTVEHFAGRARSAFYESSADSRTLLARVAFRRFAGLDLGSARIWLARLAAIGEVEVEAILGQVPSERMSPVVKSFTLKLLMINRSKLLQECDQ